MDKSFGIIHQLVIFQNIIYNTVLYSREIINNFKKLDELIKKHGF